MKISFNWLKEFVDITCSPERLAEMLSDLGFPNDGLEQIGNDTVIDLEVTSNRGDCLSYIGVAREIAAASGKEISLPKIEYPLVKKDINSLISVEVLSPNLCGRYTARIIEGVKVGTSPGWLIERLEKSGVRSVNNVVDATNYAMLECGQPPHAFDYDKIGGRKIIVRNARQGEQIVSIDGTNCKLTPDMLVIADSDRPVAVAGVMGGLDTEVSGSTVNILLEDAWFAPASVRQTCSRLALESQAAYRFSRITDIENIDWASRRTAQLIVLASGGRVVEGAADVYPAKRPPVQAEMRFSRLNKLLGIDVPPQKAVDILSALSFCPRPLGDDKLLCTVPSWRSDVSREADLIEEVARVHGYDKIGVNEKISIRIAPQDKRQSVLEMAGRYLHSCGFYETITTAFNDEKTAVRTTGRGVSEHLRVKDITRKNENLLRSSLIGSLLSVMRTNYNAGNKNLRLYEIAAVFEKTVAGHSERTSLAAVCDGDFRVLKGAVCGMVKSLCPGAGILFIPGANSFSDSGADIVYNGRRIGFSGEVSRSVLDALDIKAGGIFAAELDFDILASAGIELRVAKPLPKFPAIERDLSLIVDESVCWQRIEDAVRSAAPAELEGIGFAGIYRGKPIEAGRKSVTVSLLFRDEDGTLEHQTVDRWQAGIVSALSSSLGCSLRTV